MPSHRADMAVNQRSRAVERCGMRHARTLHLDFEEQLPGTEEGGVECVMTRDDWKRTGCGDALSAFSQRRANAASSHVALRARTSSAARLTSSAANAAGHRRVAPRIPRTAHRASHSTQRRWRPSSAS
jgi:hypothetical protein